MNESVYDRGLLISPDANRSLTSSTFARPNSAPTQAICQASKHVADTKTKIEKFVAAQSIRTGADLSADAMEAYSIKRKKAEDLSARTIQSYIVAAKAFTKWCVDSGRILSNPLSRIKSP
jgi:site-specific recombinase XerD